MKGDSMALNLNLVESTWLLDNRCYWRESVRHLSCQGVRSSPTTNRRPGQICDEHGLDNRPLILSSNWCKMLFLIPIRKITRWPSSFLQSSTEWLTHKEQDLDSSMLPFWHWYPNNWYNCHQFTLLLCQSGRNTQSFINYGLRWYQ